MEDLKREYENSVRRLALDKMRNDVLFEGKLGSVVSKLSSMGLNVTKESIFKDIQSEISRQSMDVGIKDENVRQRMVESPNVNEQQMKYDMINRIVNAMNQKGEITFGNMSNEEKMNFMKSIHGKLNSKTIEELQKLLSTYERRDNNVMSIGSR